MGASGSVLINRWDQCSNVVFSTTRSAVNFTFNQFVKKWQRNSIAICSTAVLVPSGLFFLDVNNVQAETKNEDGTYVFEKVPNPLLKINNNKVCVGNNGTGSNYIYHIDTKQYVTLPISNSYHAIGINDDNRIVAYPRHDNINPTSYVCDYPLCTNIFSMQVGNHPTSAYAINNNNVIVGVYRFKAYDLDGNFINSLWRGFSHQQADYVSLDHPNVDLSNASTWSGVITWPYDINNSNAVAGYVHTAEGYEGFTYKNGIWTTITHPNSTKGTVFRGLNDKGQIVANWGFDKTSTPNSAIYDLNEQKWTSLKTPASWNCDSVYLFDIDSDERVVGHCIINTPYNITYFLATPIDLILNTENEGKPSCIAGNPINPGTGNKYQEEADYVAAEQTGISFVRHYNSSGNTSSPIGEHWTCRWFRVFSAGSDEAHISLEDGKTYTFTLNASNVWETGPDDPVSLIGNTTDGFDFIRKNDSVEHFSGAGKLTTITDRNGRTTNLSYDTNGNLVTVTGPFGHHLTFSHNNEGRVSSMTTPKNEVYAYTYDTLGNLTTVTYPDNTTKTYLYENLNYPHALTGIIDEKNVRYSTYSYDDFGRAVQTKHANNVETATASYNENGSRIITDALGNTRTITFETLFGQALPTSVENSSCSCGPNYVYDPATGFLISRTDNNGNQTTYVRDPRGLEISRTEAVGTSQERTITTAWHPIYHLPVQIADGARMTMFGYDNNGNLISKTINSGSLTQGWAYTYNEAGQLLTADGPRSDVPDVTAYSYDASSGNLTSITNALGHVTQITAHDANGNPVTIIDPNGRQTTFTYDGRGRIVMQDVGGETTTYAYDNAGLLHVIALPDGTSLTYGYDDAHRLTSITDGAGSKITYTLDDKSNVTQENTYDISNSLKQTQTRAYDALNRLSSITDALNQTTNLTYDPNGNVINVTAPLNRTTSSSFDALNRLTQSVDPRGSTTRFTYDRYDQVATAIDSLSVQTGRSYDGLGNHLSESNADNGGKTYTYDLAGNPLTSTDARGVTLTMTYDALNRIKTITPPTESAISYTYDSDGEKGLLSSMTDPSGSTVYDYDTHGREIQRTETIAGQSFVTTTSYDTAGRVNVITYPSGVAVDYDYDSTTGRPFSIKMNGTTYISNITYEPFGSIKGWHLESGANYLRTRDQGGRLSEITFGSLGAMSITYDAASRVSGMSGTALASKAFGYNAGDQLTSYTNGGETGAYDYNLNAGRILEMDATGTTNYARTGNRLGNLTGAGAATVTHDAAGNVTQLDGLNMGYNEYGRLLTASKDGMTVTHLYNGQDRLVKTSNTNGGSTHYVYAQDGISLLGEYNTASTPVQETVWLPSGDGSPALPVLTIKGGVVYNIYPGKLGEPVIIEDQSGARVWVWDADPFGARQPDETPSASGVTPPRPAPWGLRITMKPRDLARRFASTFSLLAQPAYADEIVTAFPFNLRFPGQVAVSGTGLVSNGHRFYAPRIGQYTTPDPIGLAGGMNPYTYVSGNPTEKIDPEGLANMTLMCPQTMPTENSDWRRYWGGRLGEYVFHCGGYGFLENRTAEPNFIVNECIYDKYTKKLIDAYSPWKACTGTPDQYDEKDKLHHTLFDDGGPLNLSDTDPRKWTSRISRPIGASMEYLLQTLTNK